MSLCAACPREQCGRIVVVLHDKRAVTPVVAAASTSLATSVDTAMVTRPKPNRSSWPLQRCCRSWVGPKHDILCPPSASTSSIRAVPQRERLMQYRRTIPRTSTPTPPVQTHGRFVVCRVTVVTCVPRANPLTTLKLTLFEAFETA